MNKLILLLGIIVLFTACSNQPNCDDGDVEETVLDIIKQESSKVWEEAYYNTHYYELNKDSVRKYAEENNLNVNDLLENAKKNILEDASNYAKGKHKKLKLKLQTIRLLEDEKSIKKCNCIAELYIKNIITKDEETSEIKYTAQKTEDGEVYVEVFYE